MAKLDIQIGGHQYELACRDGDEEHLRFIAGIVESRIHQATQTMGGLNEARQLLFAALLLADELNDARNGRETPAAPRADAGVASALERLADRMEDLAERLEKESAIS